MIADNPIDPVDFWSDNNASPNHTLTPNQILAELNSTASEFEPLLPISSDQRQLLLLKFNWDIELLRSSFQEHADTKHFLFKNGICPKNSITSNSKSECAVCCFKGNVIGLRCRHMACSNCWNKYLTNKIKSGHCLHGCVEFKCNMLICNEMLGRFLCDPTLISNHQKLIIGSYVKSNPNITWCNKNCGKAVKGSSGDTVVCSCGSKFCFSCGQDPHLPATCRQIQLFHWNRLDSDQSSANWILGNTKECPRCTAPTEKRGGCDHMTCGSCGHQYCWLCLQDWHSFRCKRIDVPVERSRSNTEANLAYHLRRFEFHNAILEYEQQSLSLIEFGDVLVECRQILMYSYAYGCYLEDGPFSRSFDSHQLNFENAVGRLSENLERNRDWNRSEISELAEECQRLQKLLLGYCAKGGEYQGIAGQQMGGSFITMNDFFFVSLLVLIFCAVCSIVLILFSAVTG